MAAQRRMYDRKPWLQPLHDALAADYQANGRPGTVIVVSTRSPEASVAQDLKARGLVIDWAPSIEAAAGLLN